MKNFTKIVILMVLLGVIKVNFAHASDLTVQNIVDATNKDRTALKLKAFKFDPLLTSYAQNKADDMASKGYFSHYTPTGEFFTKFIPKSYKFWHAGENDAFNFSDTETMESAFMNSPGHKANITGSYGNIGVGMAEGVYKGYKTKFIVIFFSSVGK